MKKCCLSVQWERESPEVWWVMSLMVCTYLVYLFKDEIRIYWTIIRLRGPPALPLLGNAHYVLDKDREYDLWREGQSSGRNWWNSKRRTLYDSDRSGIKFFFSLSFEFELWGAVLDVVVLNFKFALNP